MYTVLIVDDEIHAVRAIEEAVDWKKLNVGHVYTAYNIRQAKEVLMRESIDLMLCDIEMPQGSGLELLAWVRKEHPRVESVFLTCHADFDYARQAIQLGSLDYILKPIPYLELEQVISRACDKISKESQLQQFSRYGQYWFKHQPLLTERFWLEIMNQTIPAREEAIRQAAEERHLPYMEQARHLPVLIAVQRWGKKWSARDEKIMEGALRNAAQETILHHGECGHLVQWEKDRLVALLPIEEQREAEAVQQLQEACSRFIMACNAYFYCELSCYIGSAVPAPQLSSMLERLQRLDRDNVALVNRVLIPGGSHPAQPAMNHPDLGLWAVLLKEGARDKLLQAISLHLQEWVLGGALDARQLHTFHQDLLQMMYYVLQLKGIQAHHLFADEESIELSQRAARSVTDLEEWVRHAVTKAMNYARTVEETQTVVDRVIAYIQTNREKELTREELASYVYLNPDHLTRLFKKKTGLSISEYLLRERLGVAKSLLIGTDMAVSAIAAQVGYANFSHFSKMFKKHVGVNPQEFRQSNAHRP